MKQWLRRFQGPLGSCGRYECRGGSIAPGSEQSTDHFTLNVPTGGVYVLHRAGAAHVVDPTRVVLFDAGDVFRTSHPGGCSDSGIYLRIARAELLEALAARDAAAYDVAAPIAAPVLPAPAQAALEAAALIAALERHPLPPLEVEERVLALLDRVLGRIPVERSRRPARPARARTHRDLAEAARFLLASRAAEPVSLTEVSAALGVSSFHLCRVFKEQTGTTLHRYLERLRLRGALERLRDARCDLSRLAFASGFSSHSHFTARFRREFGCTPSAFRARARS